MRGRRNAAIRRAVALSLATITLLLTFQDAFAARRRRPARHTRRPAASVQQKFTFDSALVIDVESGTILFQKDPYASRAPASLAKMMLELLVLEAVEAGEISWNDTVIVPKEVKSVRGTRVRVRVGETVTARDLMDATVIASANDAATALAIHFAGSIDACVARMNRRARELGMASTRYENVHGLDRSGEPGNVTTACDLAILARRLIAIPKAIEISSTTDTVIRSRQAIHTTNRLLRQYPGCDGLKTGYTARAGYCLVATAERGGMRLLSVVLGAASNRRRFSESTLLLNSAFERWQRVSVLAKGQDLGQDLLVRQGSEDSVRLIAGDNVNLLIPARRRSEIRVAVAAPRSTQAPIAEGWTMGRVQVLIGDSVAAECAAVAAGTVPRKSPADWLMRQIRP